MTKKDRRTIAGIVIFFSLVAYSTGLECLWNSLKPLAKGFVDLAKVLLTLITHFPDELGITDWLWTRGIYAVIAIAAAVLSGYTFTHREKKKLIGIIGAIVSLVSAVLMFV